MRFSTNPPAGSNRLNTVYRIGRRLLPALFILLLAEFGSVHAMNNVKEWVNKIKPGTFAIQDATTDAGKPKARTFSESEMKVLTALKKREEDLDKREAIHRQKAAELKSLAQQIEQKLDQMRNLTSDFEEKRKLRQNMDERDISKMVKYYETMDPERTAVFFNQMDRLTAMHILLRMNPRKASAVLELLDPKVAVDITEKITRFKESQQEVTAN